MGAGLKGMGVFASGFLGILAWKREIDSIVSIWGFTYCQFLLSILISNGKL